MRCIVLKNKNDYLRPINNSSVVQQVIDSLTNAMINGQLKPGDQIPTEVELAESFGVGRNSIREAIKILVSYGVLEIRRAEGTFVCDGFSQTMLNPLLYSIILQKDSSYNSLTELREIIEAGVVRLAIEKYDQNDIELLKCKFDILMNLLEKKEPDIQAIFDADVDFHKKTAEIGHNPLVENIHSLVCTLTAGSMLQTITNVIKRGGADYLIKAHKRIYEVIEKKEISSVDDVLRYSYFYWKDIYKDNDYMDFDKLQK